MRPWTEILPKRARHLLLCKWKYRYQVHCIRHGSKRARYGGASTDGGVVTVRKQEGVSG